MAILNGSVNSVAELFNTLITFATTQSNFTSGNAWTLVYPTAAEITAGTATEAIIKGVGDGEDEIYLGIKLDGSNILLNGYAGYDSGLSWREQPGGDTTTKLVALPLVDETLLTYWCNASSSRILIVVELSTEYECAYAGLFKPIAIENQYPYPLMLGATLYEGGVWTDTSDNHSAFFRPGTGAYTSLHIRRPDGTWRQGKNEMLGDLCVWPTNVSPVGTLTVYDDSLTLENVTLYPMYMYESDPHGMIGYFDGVYWIGNREDISAKDTVIYNNKNYKVFNNVQRRDNDSYFAIEWS